MTHPTTMTLSVLLLSSAVGCAASQAAGTRPADMTPERHCAAALEERAQAGYDRRAGAEAHAGKATVENRLRAEQNARARKHERRAEQHEQAALIASGGNARPCGPIETWSY